MKETMISSREFNQDSGRAKKAATDGPVFITDRGRPAHVLLTIEHYRTLTRTAPSIADLLAMPAASEIDFDPPKFPGLSVRPADFS